MGSEPQFTGAMRTKSCTQGSGAGGNTILYITPPEGEIWKIYGAKASHDDAAGITVDWLWADLDLPETNALFSATSVPRYLYTDVPVSLPLICHYRSQLAFRGQGMAAAKTLTVVIVYERIVGVPLSVVS